MDYLIIALEVFALIVLVTAAYSAILGGAPWIPSGKKERRQAIELAELNEGKTVYDLGSGTGKFLFEICDNNPGCRAVGIELFLLPYLYSMLKKISQPRKYQRLTFKWGNLLNCDCSDADVIFTYQMPRFYQKLQRKLGQNTKDDCRIIVEAWPFPDIKPIKKAKREKSLPLYLYEGRQFNNR